MLVQDRVANPTPLPFLYFHLNGSLLNLLPYFYITDGFWRVDLEDASEAVIY